ncbi:MAG: DUF2783 domain-containing protein [Pseudomonadota bacterium]
MTDFSTDRLGLHGDEFYAALTKAHEGLSFEDSAAMNARLVLLLANQIGDIEILKQALDEARK